MPSHARPIWRMIAAPLYGLARLHRRVVERARPVLRWRLRPDHPLPAEEDLRALCGAPIGALHLQIDSAEGRPRADLTAIRAALAAIRASGVPVHAELARAGNAELYLGSAASTLYLHPTVSAALTGVGVELNFFGALFDRLGLQFDAEAVGSFKSMAESFTRAWPTAANREALQYLVDGLQEELEAAIAAGRGLTVEEVRALLADAPLSPEAARDRRLVDVLAWPDQVEEALERACPGAPRVPLEAALDARRRVRRLEAWIAGGRRVAVLHLRGAILDGEPPAMSDAVIAATPTVEALRAIRERPDIGALVLHIDSRGGSATASDLIWREVARIQQDRPVVACMGAAAASGGYYIAAAAAEIVAQPTTLTGSIGVVGGKPVIGPALARLGVHTAAVNAAPQADYFSPSQPFRDDQRARFRASLRHFYDCFLQRVSAGRRRPVSAIEPHAQGRVWTGAQALERGLIDRLGGLPDAIARAAHLADLPLHAPIHIEIPPPGGRIARMIRKNLGVSAGASALLRAVLPELALLQALPDPGAAAVLAEIARGGARAWAWAPIRVEE